MTTTQPPIQPPEPLDENEILLASLEEAYEDGLDAAEMDMLNQMRLHQLQLIEREANDANRV